MMFSLEGQLMKRNISMNNIICQFFILILIINIFFLQCSTPAQQRNDESQKYKIKYRNVTYKGLKSLLKLYKEPSYDYYRNDQISYRLFYISSFPIRNYMVRFDIFENNSGIMHFKNTKKEGDNYVLNQTNKQSLTFRQCKAIPVVFNKLNFWHTPHKDPHYTPNYYSRDGYVVILEGFYWGRYHYVEDYNGNNRKIRKMVRYIDKLSRDLRY